MQSLKKSKEINTKFNGNFKKFGIRRDLIHKLTEFSNSFEFTSLMANYNLTDTINQKPKAYFL